MRKSKFTEEQLAFALRQTEQGITVEEVCCELGVTEQTYYRWKKKDGGLGSYAASSSSKRRAGSSRSWWRI